MTKSWPGKVPYIRGRQRCWGPQGVPALEYLDPRSADYFIQTAKKGKVDRLKRS